MNVQWFSLCVRWIPFGFPLVLSGLPLLSPQPPTTPLAPPTCGLALPPPTDIYQPPLPPRIWYALGGGGFINRYGFVGTCACCLGMNMCVIPLWGCVVVFLSVEYSFNLQGVWWEARRGEVWKEVWRWAGSELVVR